MFRPFRQGPSSFVWLGLGRSRHGGRFLGKRLPKCKLKEGEDMEHLGYLALGICTALAGTALVLFLMWVLDTVNRTPRWVESVLLFLALLITAYVVGWWLLGLSL